MCISRRYHEVARSLRRPLQHLVVCIVYLSLSLAITWPLAKAPAHQLPIGAEPSATVSLLNLWTMWWNVDRLGHGYRDYWHAPIYHPADDVFSYSEPQTVVGWIAFPLWQVLPTPGCVYNTLLVLFLTLNGWVSFLVLRRCRLDWWVSLVGGALVTTLPLVRWQMGVFQLVSLWGVASTVCALLHFQRLPSTKRATVVGLTFALTYSLCCYHGLFFSVLLLGAAPWLFGRRLLQLRFWTRALLAVTTASLLVAPVVTAQLRVSKDRPRAYRAEWIQRLSALPVDYLHTPWPQWISPPQPPADSDRFSWRLSPGTIKLGLALLGFAWGIWSRRRRRIALFLGVMAVLAFLLSMGPRLHVGEWSLYRLLADYYPGYSHVRSMFRFAFFFQWCVAILAAFGLQAILLRVRRRFHERSARWAAACAVIVAGFLVVFEVWPSPARLYRLPEAGFNVTWVGWVHDHVSAHEAIVFLPLSEDRKAKSLLPTAEKMFHQMWHRRPMANGYSAFQPIEFTRLREAVQTFPSQAAVDGLRDAGITHCALERKRKTTDDEAMRKMGFVRVLDDPVAGLEFWQVPK